MLAEFVMSNVAVSWTEIRNEGFTAVMPPGPVKAKVLQLECMVTRPTEETAEGSSNILAGTISLIFLKIIPAKLRGR